MPLPKNTLYLPCPMCFYLQLIPSLIWTAILTLGAACALYLAGCASYSSLVCQEEEGRMPLLWLGWFSLCLPCIVGGPFPVVNSAPPRTRGGFGNIAVQTALCYACAPSLPFIFWVLIPPCPALVLWWCDASPGWCPMQRNTVRRQHVLPPACLPSLPHDALYASHFTGFRRCPACPYTTCRLFRLTIVLHTTLPAHAACHVSPLVTALRTTLPVFLQRALFPAAVCVTPTRVYRYNACLPAPWPYLPHTPLPHTTFSRCSSSLTTPWWFICAFIVALTTTTAHGFGTNNLLYVVRLCSNALSPFTFYTAADGNISRTHLPHILLF